MAFDSSTLDGIISTHLSGSQSQCMLKTSADGNSGLDTFNLIALSDILNIQSELCGIVYLLSYA